MTKYDDETDAERTDRLAADANPHGFTVRNSLTGESWQQSQADARETAQTEPPPTFGDVGQGSRGDAPITSFTTAQLGSFAFFTEHKAEILAAHARHELPGQDNYTTHPLDN